jgi:RNase P/RNase MRP subunit p30
LYCALEIGYNDDKEHIIAIVNLKERIVMKIAKIFLSAAFLFSIGYQGTLYPFSLFEKKEEKAERLGKESIALLTLAEKQEISNGYKALIEEIQQAKNIRDIYSALLLQWDNLMKKHFNTLLNKQDASKDLKNLLSEQLKQLPQLIAVYGELARAEKWKDLRIEFKKLQMDLIAGFQKTVNELQQ